MFILFISKIKDLTIVVLISTIYVSLSFIDQIVQLKQFVIENTVFECAIASIEDLKSHH